MAEHAQHRAVFLDRDGVINENRPDYVRSWSQLRIIPNALPALAKLAASDYRVVIVTNQSPVGRGLITRATADEINARLVALIHDHGGRIDRVEMCPDHPDQPSECRKPHPGMLKRAADALGVDLTRSWMVGDALSDLQAGHAAGCRPVFVRSGRGSESDLARDPAVAGAACVDDLAAAIALILADGAI